MSYESQFQASLDRARSRYDSQEPCEGCGEPCNSRWCKDCIKQGKDKENED